MAQSGAPTPAWRGLLRAGLIVAALDGIEVSVFVASRGGSPVRMWQGVAGGLIGRPAALEGGIATAILGVIVHCCVAMTVVAFYFLLAKQLSPLRAQPLLWGTLYGFGVYFFMQFAVLPLTALKGGGMPTALPALLNGFVAHVFCVGIPTALLARRALGAPR
jgi:hypothetical protein